jgi:hypothetical protein
VWSACLRFYDSSVSQAVCQAAFARLFSDDAPQVCLIAVQPGRPNGFTSPRTATTSGSTAFVTGKTSMPMQTARRRTSG